jgi:hypothetical protein
MSDVVPEPPSSAQSPRIEVVGKSTEEARPQASAVKHVFTMAERGVIVKVTNKQELQTEKNKKKKGKRKKKSQPRPLLTLVIRSLRAESWCA